MTKNMRWTTIVILIVTLLAVGLAAAGAARAQTPVPPVQRIVGTPVVPVPVWTPDANNPQNPSGRVVATPTATRPAPPPTRTPVPPTRYCMQGQVDRYEKIDKPLIQIDGRVLDHRGKPMRNIIVRVFAYTVDVRTQTEAHGTFQVHGLVQAMDWNVDLPGLHSPAVVAQFRDNGPRGRGALGRARARYVEWSWR
jgi:hypothetical protein